MKILITGSCGHIGSYLSDNVHKIKNVLWKSITYRSEELGNSLVNELQKNLGTDDGR